MKKQYFQILCQEKEVQIKVIMAYMNWFCVNEDDQFEIRGIENWESYYEYIMRNDDLLQRMRVTTQNMRDSKHLLFITQ